MNGTNDKDNISNSASEHRYAQTTQTKSSKKRGRFNFVDFCLIIMLVAAVTAIAAYLLPNFAAKFSNKEEVDLVYVIEFSGVDSDFIANIKAEDAVYDSAHNYKIGTVKTVENDNYSVLVYNEALGESEMKNHPELKNIIVTIECKAIYAEQKGYLVNGHRISVGQMYNLRFPSFSGSGYCIDVYASDTQ